MRLESVAMSVPVLLLFLELLWKAERGITQIDQ